MKVNITLEQREINPMLALCRMSGFVLSCTEDTLPAHGKPRAAKQQEALFCKNTENLGGCWYPVKWVGPHFTGYQQPPRRNTSCEISRFCMLRKKRQQKH